MRSHQMSCSQYILKKWTLQDAIKVLRTKAHPGLYNTIGRFHGTYSKIDKQWAAEKPKMDLEMESDDNNKIYIDEGENQIIS